jgi:hypothetical protein
MRRGTCWHQLAFYEVGGFCAERRGVREYVVRAVGTTGRVAAVNEGLA